MIEISNFLYVKRGYCSIILQFGNEVEMWEVSRIRNSLKGVNMKWLVNFPAIWTLSEMSRQWILEIIQATLTQCHVTVAQAFHANCGDHEYEWSWNGAKWFVDGIGLLIVIKCNIPDLAESPELSGARALWGAWRMHSLEGKGRPCFLLHRDSGRCELFLTHASKFGRELY